MILTDFLLLPIRKTTAYKGHRQYQDTIQIEGNKDRGSAEFTNTWILRNFWGNTHKVPCDWLFWQIAIFLLQTLELKAMDFFLRLLSAK